MKIVKILSLTIACSTFACITTNAMHADKEAEEGDSSGESNHRADMDYFRCLEMQKKWEVQQEQQQTREARGLAVMRGESNDDCDVLGDAMLHRAAQRGETKEVERLLGLGKDSFEQGYCLRTPAMAAWNYEKLETAAVLLDDMLKKDAKKAVSMTDRWDQQHLWHAAHSFDKTSVAKLLAQGAVANYKSPQSHETARERVQEDLGFLEEKDPKKAIGQQICALLEAAEKKQAERQRN